MFNQFDDGLRLLRGEAVVGFEHADEGPLGPVVVVGVAGAHLAVPVERESYLVQLLAVVVDVGHGGHLGVLSRLYGILFGGQSIGVIAHGVEHVKSLLSLVPGIDVRSDIS